MAPATQAPPSHVDSDAMERAAICSEELSINYGVITSKNSQAQLDGAAPELGLATGSSMKKDQVDDEDQILQGIDGRYPALDMIRVVCICMVCVDHGGTPFGKWNTMFVQAWVLQYLFLICGICFGMTRRGLPSFIFRLALYWVIGVGCNLTAWIVLGKDWKHNMWNVVFQFWFVVALILYLAFASPLKAHLCRVRDSFSAGDEPHHPLFGIASNIVLLGIGFVVLRSIYMHILIPMLQLLLADPIVTAVKNCLGPAAEFWGMPTNSDDAKVFIATFFSYFHLSLSNLYIVVCFPMVFSKLSLVGWLVLLNTYSQKMLFYRAQEARVLNGFDTVMLGLVCFYYGFSKRQVIGEYLVRYWFVLLFVCACLWPPGQFGRLDEDPPSDLYTRATYNLLEFIFVVLFLTAMERMVDPAIFTKDRMEYLGNWTLLLFLVHKAVHLLVPPPMNWVVLILLAVPCYLYQHYGSQCRSNSPVKSGCRLN